MTADSGKPKALDIFLATIERWYGGGHRRHASEARQGVIHDLLARHPKTAVLRHARGVGRILTRIENRVRARHDLGPLPLR